MRYSIVLIWDDEVCAWVAEVPSLNVSTQGDSVEHALDMAADLIRIVKVDYDERGEALPVESEPVQLHTIDVDA